MDSNKWTVLPKALPKDQEKEVMQASYQSSYKGESVRRETGLRNARRKESILRRAQELLEKKQAVEKEAQRKEALLYQFGDKLSLNKNSIPSCSASSSGGSQKPITVWNSSGKPQSTFSGVSANKGVNEFGRSTAFSKPMNERT
mmetsp:Transcript_14663/g.17583  ORF Transcript_14663/g.17583 Transcript_14663/m.17583 type:complete len:144 (-) Transcript_14663:255-686(-)|eukprot:jgi/Bigna1/85818/estExt_fgenesh1_pg.C_60192